MPINVRPEMMEAAEKHLREFDPATDWKDSAIALMVAAFGEKQLQGSNRCQFCAFTAGSKFDVRTHERQVHGVRVTDGT